MQDTLADNWRQRMAGRSAVCAVLLAVPVAVAAQISFSAGLDNVPFGVSTFAAGPQTSSIGSSNTATPGQNLTTLLDDAQAAGPASGAGATGGDGGGGGSPAGGPAPEGVAGGTGGFDPGAPGDDGSGGGPGDGGPTGPPDGPDPPEPVPPAPTAPDPEPPATPAPQPVPGVNVPDVGAAIDNVTAPIGQAGELLPGGG